MLDLHAQEFRTPAASCSVGTDVGPFPSDVEFSFDARATPTAARNKPGEDSKNQPSDERVRGSKPADFNRDIYYRNKLEFSLDGGWLPINIPFPFDVFESDAYVTYPLKYTLVPIIASLRWQMGNVGGPWILRGNWDLTLSE